ncbi:TatD family hydrolase [Rubellicoccus peritrichatus]|uniref:TatD family hydrolase n=1 Tax=Rubellicoccus peritrichatus TaxID=3080537 RepID=A0AAQ3QWN2_9BACT|nr:TatD family hydrolase [Puniceicoccus sp. CR14]WOO42903.1 TatD family hydrolase [Puniceicoccus sp. CR14]
MELIDTHCHLAKSVQARKLNEVLANAAEAGVGRMITIGTSPEDWKLYAELAAAHPGQIYWTAGLHPSDVDKDFRDHLTALAPFWTEDPHPVAVGEIGLDYFRLPKDQDEAAKIKRYQYDAFRFQLDLALQFDMPVVVHSRASFDDCIKTIDASGFPWERVVFHCFAEGAEEMQRLNSRGGRGSFTGIVTFKNAEAMRQAVVEQGLEKLMVETDAPYLAPEPHRGKPCEPAMVRHTAEKCAVLLKVDPEALAERTTKNAEDFFNLNG